MPAVFQTDLPGKKLLVRGKVRDVYDLGQALLIVATDRLSAFDVVLPTPIPDKGRVLTGMSQFWFTHVVRGICEHHFLTGDLSQMGHGLEAHAELLQGRVMLVKKAEKVIPVECVVRGYLAGSGWKEYQESGSVCGLPLPKGYRQGARLEEPLFTPATKAERGQHDENISFARVGELVGEGTARAIRETALRLYQVAAEHARQRGIIIADTKFEFGFVDGRITLIDEVLTPDSSRFWPADRYTPGKIQLAYDKQFVRDYLTSIGWDKRAETVPELPEKVVQKTREKYIEAYEQLTGEPFPGK